LSLGATSNIPFDHIASRFRGDARRMSSTH
jgi:hypothetical protein